MNVDIKTNNSTFDATFKEYLQQALVGEFDGLTLQFRSDGICVSSYPDGEQEEDAYTVSGNTITMTEYDESYTYSISGNQLSATFDATEMLQEELGELEEPGMNIIINKATYTLIFKKQ